MKKISSFGFENFIKSSKNRIEFKNKKTPSYCNIDFIKNEKNAKKNKKNYFLIITVLLIA